MGPPIPAVVRALDTFEHLKHGGRVEPVSAAMGTMLQSKPLLHIDVSGRLDVVEKTRGTTKAMAAQIRKMEESWNCTMSKLVVIGHGDCLKRAEELKAQLMTRFPDADVHISEIGPIIGSHTGPGMLALIFWGYVR